MPQHLYPLTISAGDTSYTVYSTDEMWQLPDSILSQQTKEYYYELSQKLTEPIKQTDTGDDDFGWVPFMLVLFFILFIIKKRMLADEEVEQQKEEQEHYNQQGEYYLPAFHKYEGSSLKYSEVEIHSICEKYNPFYRKLNGAQKLVFINRLRHFINYKDFYIPGGAAYKEMPVLLSAAAVQISFGLDEYLFPRFSSIVIHPEEYIAYEPLRILVGNVQGKNIAISWKHFLEDYQNPSDGKNVGLHEMAHALQVQYLFENYGYSQAFQDDYAHYDKIDDSVQEAERSSTARLFDDNALKNSNEFWATSVELFFEKPQPLKQQYPHLYDSISVLLNQDTAAMG